MVDPSTYRPAAGTIPDEPGVYRFYDEHDSVLYVGKAKNLRSRLNSYFADPSGLHPRTATMVTSASRVDWVVVGNEVEALQLEYSWIKAYEPRFNVKYADDKSYPYLAVTVGEAYPRITVMRGARRKGVRYFGPYSHAWAIRETVDQLLRVFPARTCSKGVFRRSEVSGRPCLLGYIAKCSAPCVGRVTQEEHRQIIDDFCAFMAGRTDPYLKGIERGMKEAAAAEDFERAARLRDDLFALQKALEKNTVVFNDRTDADVVAISVDQLQAAVQFFHVRGGRVTGQRGLIVDRTVEMAEADLLEQALLRVYADAEPDFLPRELLVNEEPTDAETLASLLSSVRGSNVRIRVPRRGDKKALLDTVKRNADQSLVLHQKRRAGDLTVRSQALRDIQESLELESAPLRIEGYDISTLGGKDTVASMVVFEDGLAKKSDYRRFNISAANAGSDVDAIAEVIDRRFRRYLKSREEATDLELDGDPGDTHRDRQSFSYPPQLVLVDGGPPQVKAARRALDELGMADLPVAGLAKRLEEVFVVDDPEPIVLSRSSPALVLLQQLRDEAHRFAIAGHRRKRAKRSRISVLDEIPGLGPAKRKQLLSSFGSVKAVRAASAADLQEVPGIGPTLAEVIVAHFRGDAAPASQVVNLTTGEVLDG
ncbi:MAG: excinuclease ABC subunit UvrC [Actinobacteria bacterium]|nr:excinuclease ABC subunit UvrC [Actinomycetota bacterium]